MNIIIQFKLESSYENRQLVNQKKIYLEMRLTNRSILIKCKEGMKGMSLYYC